MDIRSTPRDPLIDWSQDRLSSFRFGPFLIMTAHAIPTYLADNLVALRHWKPPEW